MGKNITGRILVSLAISAIAFGTFARSPNFATMRAVDILLLMGSGIALGSALVLFRVKWQTKAGLAGGRG